MSILHFFQCTFSLQIWEPFFYYFFQIMTKFRDDSKIVNFPLSSRNYQPINEDQESTVYPTYTR